VTKPAEREDHRSIGEVLALLQDEFPDVTVSKIRFLESQGLIAPERTPSGYRKFYDDDVDRLRWILRQQKDHYLPLKVIKTRLTRIEEEGATDTAEMGGPDDVPLPEALDEEVAPDGTAGENGDARSASSGAVLNREELARATGLDERMLKELEGYGLLPAPTVVGDVESYDEHALVVARLARGFMRHGVEARHLRMYKTFAEREAGFVSQLVTPLLKQKNPEARRQARELVAELARLGGGMRAAMLRLALKGALDE
jgi:DNA-binding transcriptional MerR regulator